MTFPVKYYQSGMPGAPVLSNNWGDLVALLDACLVTGFNLKTIDSITFAAGFATASISSGHTYAVDQVVAVAGADQEAYNGEQRLSAVTANTITYPVTGTPVTPATAQGAISCKVASLGWEKAFAGTHKAAYRSLDPQSPRHYLRVDNSQKSANGFTAYPASGAKWANVGVCEMMTDIDTITGAQAPFDPLLPTKNWQAVQANQWGWHKWYHAAQNSTEASGDGGAGSRSWQLIGDGRLFYFSTNFQVAGAMSGRVLYCFGDPISFKAGDASGTLLLADDLFNSATSLSFPGSQTEYGLTQSRLFAGKTMLRNFGQLGGPVRWGVTSLKTSASGTEASGRLVSVPWPNGPDYALWLLPAYIQQEDGHMRGLMPGLRWIPQVQTYSDLTVVENVLNEPGRKFLLAQYQYGGEFNSASLGFDLTGPWR